MFKRLTVLCLLAAALCAVPLAAAPIGYVAAIWGRGSVSILDTGMNPVSSFAVGNSNPNGIATDGSTIWVGAFSPSKVMAYDFAGNFLYEWAGSFSGLQGMELVNGELAIQNNTNIEFYNPLTGAYIRSIPGPGSSTEGLTYDGKYLYGIVAAGASGITLMDPSNGAVMGTIANAAGGCTYQGTGIASIGGGQLTLACENGNWFTVLSSDGSVVTSGNNGLQMYGLKAYSAAVPEPASMLSLGAGLLLLGYRLRRRSA
ncbi:MAG: PEP-CTERM sorting domain-containing protein [Acidobacteria bacterium]|nr:PEP-CTERM sorting domain-containing protein [Acidobacteriota bacterium]